jgi:hypothetical protein
VYFKKVLLFGAQTRTFTKREGSRIQATEMKFLRAIIGKTMREIIRNTHIREDSGWIICRTKLREID